MRIGTWNLDAKWTSAHHAFIEQTNCDLWLLTEVSPALAIDGHTIVRSPGSMARGQSYAALVTRSKLEPLPAPHGASALALWNGLRVCSSVLPWPSAPDAEPWIAGTTVAKAEAATTAIAAARPQIWGGDWNHPLQGDARWHYPGQAMTLGVVQSLGLWVPTIALPHRIRGLCSIDHISIPIDWTSHYQARLPSGTLSDHDAYVIEASR